MGVGFEFGLHEINLPSNGSAKWMSDDEDNDDGDDGGVHGGKRVREGVP